jgi:hypothetical protein
MSPTLLDLPRELRDEIYNYLSNAPPAPGKPLPLDKLSSGTRRYTEGLHSLLRVNRMFRYEALDHIKDRATYLVSQRYQASAGLPSMTLCRPAPIPAHAQRLYLRIYIATPGSVAQSTGHAIYLAWTVNDVKRRALKKAGGPTTSGETSHDDPIENFNVLNSLLRGCLCLEELVLELLFKQEKNPLGVNGESTENHKGPANISRIQAKREMEMVIRELPAMRRYVVLGLDSGIMRRNPGQPWTHQCPPVRYGDICHFYEPYDTTCFGDSVDLLTNLRPTARKSWVSLS